MNIAVVTPLFPTAADPVRGRWLYSTVLALTQYASVEVYHASSVYPDATRFQPRSFSYERIERDYRARQVPVRVAPFRALPVISRPINGFACARALWKRMSVRKVDVILAYHAYPVGWAATCVAKRLHVPVALCAIGSDLRRIPDPLTSFFVKRALLNADAVITKSDELRSRALRFGVPENKVTTIRNGCDKSVFRVQSKSNSRTALGVSMREQTLVFVGRLSEVKGFYDLLQAVELIVESHPNLRVICIGSGDRRDIDTRFPHLRSRLTFLGILSPIQISQWLAAADLICLPSHSEGCPNVLLEAKCSGCPIVATAVGGIPEIVSEDCGILVPLRDPSRLSRAISAGLSRTWDRNAISREMKRGWSDVGAELHEVCSRIIRAHSLPVLAWQSAV